MKKQIKSKNGITLIALVITIVVLLILAGVTVVTLTGDNGLLQKAQNAGEQSKIAETEEQIKLLYAEYQISKYVEGNTNAGEYLKEQLEKTYGKGNVDIISQEESIVLKVTDNGELKFYEYTPSTGISKEIKKGINYNEKTASEIRPGDDITIVKEKFKVISKTDTEIKAIPYYNIELKLDNPKQSKTAEAIGFSSEYYWKTGENEINMSHSKNKIQKYINAYEQTLEKLGAEDIMVRISRLDDLLKINNTTWRNPTKNGEYWIGTSDSNSQQVKYVDLSCGISYTTIWYNKGVRPIIVISY